MKKEIQKYFEENNQYIKSDELKKKLNVKGEEQTNSFYCALNALVEDGCLFFDEKKGYKLFTNELGYAYGQIEINKSGNGFIHTKDGYTIFISNEDLNGALNGDKVMVSSIDFGRRDNFKGEVFKVLKRKTGNVIYEVVGSGYESTLMPYNINENVYINVNKNQLKNLIDGDLILVKVGTYNYEGVYSANIDKVIGHKSDAGIDIRLIYTKHNIPIEFSKEVMDEVDKLPTEVNEEDIKDRVDLRDKDFVTIDCDGTKDRDDAISIEKLENGNYKLYTSIASVNYYVKRDSKLFEEAMNRCTSHYPNNTCNPMFPHKLSNGICSLNPNVDRLTKTVEMEIDKNGIVVDYNIYNSVMKSRKAMKYSEVNKILKGEIVEGYENYINQLNLFNELNIILENARNNRDCIDFDIPDVEVKQNKEGIVEGFIVKGSGSAERIIENCMLITNETVAEHYSWLPFIYRVHECPNEQTVKNVINLLRLSNFNIPKFNNVDEKTINYILDNIKDSEEAKIVRTILLKSMKRARYDINNVGHFALQLNDYCHFTSPIRRVADFMIHTIIDEIDNFDYTAENLEKLEIELKNVAENATAREKLAENIEDEALAMAMAEYMEKHIGEGFDAIVTEVYEHGMFVKTKDMISGKIKFEDMLDDKYRYDYEKKAIIGKNTKNKYQIGNKVYVIAKEASKENRTINFEIGKQKTLKK